MKTFLVTAMVLVGSLTVGLAEPSGIAVGYRVVCNDPAKKLLLEEIIKTQLQKVEGAQVTNDYGTCTLYVFALPTASDPSHPNGCAFAVAYSNRFGVAVYQSLVGSSEEKQKQLAAHYLNDAQPIMHINAAHITDFRRSADTLTRTIVKDFVETQVAPTVRLLREMEPKGAISK